MSRLYSASLANFRQAVLTNRIYPALVRDAPRSLGMSATGSEERSWRGSLPRLEQALRLADLPPDVHVLLEERLPYYQGRIDACLFGHAIDARPYSILVELKGWGIATARPDGNVDTWIGGAERARPHPSEQVRAYGEHLEDFRRIYQGPDRIGLASLAYCHNYPGIVPDEGLFHPRFDDLRTDSPTFGEGDAECLAGYFRARLSGGRGARILEGYDKAGIGPSRRLIDHATEMIGQQSVFRLLDEQIAANRAIELALRNAMKRRKPQVLLVNGGPGTGKSVIAMNALGEALRHDRRVFLVSGSSAYTNGLRRVLGRRLEPLLRFTDFFWNAAPGSIDVLLVDEAHRLRRKSQPKVLGPLRPTISQTEELMRAARVTVFFVDRNQIISPDEVGEPELILSVARSLGARVEQFDLSGQFRCGGSATYLDWLDDLLELAGPSEGRLLARPTGFDLRFVDSGRALWDEVQRHNSVRPNSARLVAGWCWPWSAPLPDGLANDVDLGDIRLPWEAKSGKRRPPGIPPAKYWAVDPAGAGQVGTVYSMQGFEIEHVGVVIGPDLVVRDGVWTARPRANFSNGLRAKPPEVALPYIKRIYRTLLSRGMQSCTVHCTDRETYEFVRSRTVAG